MTTPPGGHIPPINPDSDSVPAALSEGYAFVPAAAFDRYGPDFLGELGGIPAENVYPVEEQQP